MHCHLWLSVLLPRLHFIAIAILTNFSIFFPLLCSYYGQKILAVIFCHFKKYLCNLFFSVIMIIDYRLDYDWYFLGGKFQNSKLYWHILHTERSPQVIYVRLL
jgi:hypothetical protein